jgi:hypothetical protein
MTKMAARTQGARWTLPDLAPQWILHAIICYPLTRIVFCAVQTAGKIVPAGR